jgi:hypothetical protein
VRLLPRYEPTSEGVDVRAEQTETALQEDWWAGEDEAWEAGMLALATDEPRSIGWMLSVWLAVAVVASAIMAVAAVVVYRVVVFLQI